jgi:hypothetical protein
MKQLLSNMRVEFLTWMIIPLIGLWLAMSYLIGIIHPPQWQKSEIASDPAVLAARTKKVFAAQKPTKLQWDGSTALVTLWFDDAWDSQFSVAYPQMDDMGLVGSIAIPTQAIGTQGYMSWAQLERIAYARWQVDSHTRTHTCDIKGLSVETANSEIVGSKQDLESFGYVPSFFVSPCGVDSPLWKDTVKKHYLAFRGVEAGVNPLPLTDLYRLKAQMVTPKTTVDDVKRWLAEAQAQKSWLIITFHQIDNSNAEYSVTPENFKKILTTVKESHTPVVLPEQVINLVVNSN